MQKCKRDRVLSKIAERYWLAASFRKKIDPQWMGSIYAGHTQYDDLVFQSEHATLRMSDGRLTKRINLDGTWTKVVGSDSVIFNQIVFYAVSVPAPSIDRTSKSLFIGAALTLGKKKERYRAVAQVIGSLSDYDNIMQLSTDYEWSLFTEFNLCCWTEAELYLCFFHRMQNFMKRLRV